MNIVQDVPLNFFGETLVGYMSDDGHIYVPLRHLCKVLGIEVASQRQRILRNPVTADSLIPLKIPTPFRNRVRPQKTLCLDSTMLVYWLSSLDTRRIREDKREQIIENQRELAEAAGYLFIGDPDRK